MKIQLKLKSSRHAGNALLMVMILAVIVVPILWGTLDLNVKTQHRSVAISQNWNGVLPLVEAGVEEGLAHLNRNCYSNAVNGGVVQWSGVDGWTNESEGVFRAATKQVGSSYYDLWITTNAPATNDMPDIICTAYSPTLFGKLGLIPIYGTVGQTLTPKSMIGRQVRVSTAKYNLFLLSVGAKGDIVFNGQGGVDSFNSQSPSDSFYGLYDPRYHTDEAIIGSTDSNINLGALGVVYGEATTNPDGTLTNGTIGSVDWVDGGNKGTEDGRYQNDLNMNLHDVELPDGAESWPFLPTCYCPITITNPVREAKTIVSPIYPNPLPPGGIISTSTLLVTTESYPSPAPATGVETNLTLSTSATYPNPEPPFGVRTNAGDTMQTQASYPLVFVTPPGVTTNTTTVTRTEYPADGTYLGEVTTDVVKKPGGKDNWQTNYTYANITGYSFVSPISYTWTNYSYSYLTDTAYKYIGAVTNQTIETRTYKYAVPAGNWRMTNLELSDDRMLIRAPGHTTLYVTGNISMSGKAQIIVEYGASVSIYLAGNADLAGQGIANESEDALNFQLYGLNTCTEIKIGGNASFAGTIYAPYADISAKGGGRDRIDIIGAIIGNSVTFNGHFNLHFDTAINLNGPSWGFYATRWVEEAVD